MRSEPLELGELCRAVAAEFELTAGERHARLSVHPPAQPCWAHADPGAVARIVRILLDNALRVAPAGSAVEVDVSSDAGWGRLSVRDHGPGVPADERELIFERFKRGSTTGGRGGFGLGLAIGRELAARMGGTLELRDGLAARMGGTLELRDGLAARMGGTLELRDGLAAQDGACFRLRLPTVSDFGDEEPPRI